MPEPEPEPEPEPMPEPMPEPEPEEESSGTTYSYDVTSNGFIHYIINGENDPTLTISLGDTLRLTNNLNAHPLYIKTALGYGTTNQITDGSVTGQGSTNGTVVFTPTSIGTYYYQCSAHPEMNGIIQVEY